MIIYGTIEKAVVRTLLGPHAQVEYTATRRRRHFWPTTSVTMTYAAALRRLRQLRGPDARFVRHDQYGIEGWAVHFGTGTACRVAVVHVGPPDWAGLLSAGINVQW